MKKNTKIYILLLVVCTIAIKSFAQDLPPAEVKDFGKFQQTQSDNGENNLVCSPNFIFGQAVSISPLNGAPSLLLPGNSGYMLVDNYTNGGTAVSGITFWGLFQIEGICFPSQPVLFRVCFYEGSYTNAPIYQYDLSLTGELIDLGGLPIFRFDGTFPEPADLPAEGFISVQQIVDPFQPPCFFYWLASMEGDFSSTLVFIEGGEIVNSSPLPFDWSFCLYEAPAVPLTNWALMIGVMLIFTTLIIRFRKYQA